MRPWLYGIAHNESISLLSTLRPDSDRDAAAHVGDATAAGALESRERLRSLTEDLRELTERQRGALLVRELGGMEFLDIAEALQTSAPAAKQSVYEARCALQAMQEGRAMDCDEVQRAISDGDRRVPRGMRMRASRPDPPSGPGGRRPAPAGQPSGGVPAAPSKPATPSSAAASPGGAPAGAGEPATTSPASASSTGPAARSPAGAGAAAGAPRGPATAP